MQFALLIPVISGGVQTGQIDTGTRKELASTPPRPQRLEKPYYAPIIYTTDDQSTGPNKVTNVPVTVVSASSVTVTTVIRDMTAGELNTAKDTEADGLINNRSTKVAFILMYKIIRAGVTNDWSEFSAITSPATFKAFVKSLL